MFKKIDMVLIDFTDEEIRHIFMSYPTHQHHPQIWSKLLRAMIPSKQEDKDEEFQEKLRKDSEIIAMHMMNSIISQATTLPPPQTYPPTYDTEISSIRSTVGMLIQRIERLEAQIAALVNMMNRQ